MARKLVFISFIAILLTGCGGGTAGTAPSHSRSISGLVERSFAGDTVQIPSAGLQSKVGDDGRFQLSGPVSGPMIMFALLDGSITPKTMEIPVRREGPSKVGMIVDVRRDLLAPRRLVDAALVSSCPDLFREDGDLQQVAFGDESCRFTLRSQTVGEGPFSARMRAVRCPTEVLCPGIQETSLAPELVIQPQRGNDGLYCETVIDIFADRDLLTTVRISPILDDARRCP